MEDESSRLRDAILSLQPTAYWPLDDGSGPLRDIAHGWNASVTGTPTFRVAAPSPIERGVTFGSGNYGTAAAGMATPTASMSVFAVLQTSDVTAIDRHIAGRGSTGQYSWTLNYDSAQRPVLVLMQQDGTPHCATLVAASSVGTRQAILGTFDSSTAWIYSNPGTPAGASSSSRAGSWYKSTTTAITVANTLNGYNQWPGFLAHVAYWNDRVLTANDFRHLSTLALGS